MEDLELLDELELESRDVAFYFFFFDLSFLDFERFDLREEDDFDSDALD